MFDDGSVYRRTRGAFPTNSQPTMTEGPNSFELRLGKGRARVMSLLVFACFALLFGTIGFLVRGQEGLAGLATILMVGAGVMLAAGLALAALAKEHVLKVSGEGILYTRGSQARKVPSRAIREVRFGRILRRAQRSQGRNVRDQLEVHLTDGSRWWVIMGTGDPYMAPLAKAIGRLCGRPVRDMGDVPSDGPDEGFA